MEKVLVSLIGGIIIGAAIVEILNKKCPGSLKKLEKKVGKGIGRFSKNIGDRVEGAAEAFAEGYRNAASPQAPATATT